VAVPALLVLLAAVCFGTTGTALALGPGGVAPFSAGAVRIVVGGAILAAVVLVARPRGPRVATVRRAGAARCVPSGILVAVGAIAVVVYQPAFFVGTTRVGVAVGTVVALGSAPVFTGALEWVVSRRFPGPVWVTATLVAGIGVFLLAAGTGDGTTTDPVGILGSLAAGASYGAYALVAKTLIARGADPSWVMGALFGTAAIASVPIALSTDLRWLAAPSGLLVALWLGIVTTAVAYLLFGRGLSELAASTASTLTLAEPMTATLLGVLVLGERLGWSATAGIAVVAVAIVVLIIAGSRPASRRAMAHPDETNGIV
jgi:DME family drug/metabolite transporter